MSAPVRKSYREYRAERDRLIVRLRSGGMDFHDIARLVHLSTCAVRAIWAAEEQSCQIAEEDT